MLLLLKLAHQLIEPLCDVVQLLFEEPRQLLLHLFYHLRVVLNQPLRIVDHLPQIYHVLLHRVSYKHKVILEAITHFLDLHELVAIVVVVDALDADLRGTGLTKVLNHLMRVFRARDALKVSE